MASDSRISWPDGTVWDSAVKTFTSATRPLLLGYSGDTLVPIHAVLQLMPLIDTGVLSPSSDDHAAIVNLCATFVEQVQATAPRKLQSTFSLLIGSRHGAGVGAQFGLSLAKFRSDDRFVIERVSIPGHSEVVAVIGSGRQAFLTRLGLWQQSDWARTSRGVFAAFCDTLRAAEDRQTGGAPQVVAVYRPGAGRHLCVSWNGVPFAGGVEVDHVAAATMQCRNVLFERCLPNGAPIANAQRHPRPKNAPTTS